MSTPVNQPTLDFFIVSLPNATDRTASRLEQDMQFADASPNVAREIELIRNQSKKINEIDGRHVERISGLALTGEVQIDRVKITYQSDGKLYEKEMKKSDYLELC